MKWSYEISCKKTLFSFNFYTLIYILCYFKSFYYCYVIIGYICLSVFIESIQCVCVCVCVCRSEIWSWILSIFDGYRLPIYLDYLVVPYVVHLLRERTMVVKLIYIPFSLQNDRLILDFLFKARRKDWFAIQYRHPPTYSSIHSNIFVIN